VSEDVRPAAVAVTAVPDAVAVATGAMVTATVDETAEFTSRARILVVVEAGVLAPSTVPKIPYTPL